MKTTTQVFNELSRLAPPLAEFLSQDRHWLWYHGPEVSPLPGRIKLITAKRDGVCDETGLKVTAGDRCLYQICDRKKRAKAKLFSLKSKLAKTHADALALMEVGFIHAANGHPLEDEVGTWGHSCEAPLKFKPKPKSKDNAEDETTDIDIDEIARELGV